MLNIHSKLSDQGVTIFSVMSAMAQRLNALNMSQGFPDFPAPPALLEALGQATQDGFNQYAAGDGLLILREQLAKLFLQRDQLQIDPISEITITPGATIGIFSAIHAVVNPGDEVIIFDPSYDSYAPSVKLAGGVAVHIPLQTPDFHVDWNQVQHAINDKTRMIIVNTPHNPTGAIWAKQDWLQLITLIEIKISLCCLMRSMNISFMMEKDTIQRCASQNSVNVVLSWALLVKPFMSQDGKRVIALQHPHSCKYFVRFINLLISAGSPLYKWLWLHLWPNILNILRNLQTSIKPNAICSMQV